jgi:hypothetical protein
MPSLNQIADFIADRLNEPYNDMLKADIKFSVKYWRAFLIRQDVERNGTSRDYLQRFVVELVKVDKGDTCAVDIGCKILKTKNAIPEPIRLKPPTPFKYVGEVGGGAAFTHTELEELPFTTENKYTANVIRYNYTNKYIYVYGNIRMKYLAVEGVFLDPAQAVDFCISSADCFSDDEEFPIGGDMLKILIDALLKGEFNIRREVEPQDVDIVPSNDNQ